MSPLIVDILADNPGAGPVRRIECQQSVAAAEVKDPLVGFKAVDEEIVVPRMPVLGMGAAAMGDSVTTHQGVERGVEAKQEA